MFALCVGILNSPIKPATASSGGHEDTAFVYEVYRSALEDSVPLQEKAAVREWTQAMQIHLLEAFEMQNEEQFLEVE